MSSPLLVAARKSPAMMFQLHATQCHETAQCPYLLEITQAFLRSPHAPRSRNRSEFHSARTAASPEFDGARGAALAAITAAVQCSEGLPILLQTAGGASLKWLCGFAEDAEGPLVLEPASSGSAPSPLVWRDLSYMLADSKTPPLAMLLFRVAPIRAETRSLLNERAQGIEVNAISALRASPPHVSM